MRPWAARTQPRRCLLLGSENSRCTTRQEALLFYHTTHEAAWTSLVDQQQTESLSIRNPPSQTPLLETHFWILSTKDYDAPQKTASAGYLLYNCYYQHVHTYPFIRWLQDHISYYLHSATSSRMWEREARFGAFTMSIPVGSLLFFKA